MQATGKRILVVDDDKPVRQLINEVLTSDGHSVTEAADGIEALALFDVSDFDLIITDLEMPNMRGGELVDRLRISAPAQPIIMVSSNVFNMVYPRAKINALLPKPFLIEDLLRTVDDVLEDCRVE